jgi:hypothetical protein
VAVRSGAPRAARVLGGIITGIPGKSRVRRVSVPDSAVLSPVAQPRGKHHQQAGDLCRRRSCSRCIEGICVDEPPRSAALASTDSARKSPPTRDGWVNVGGSASEVGIVGDASVYLLEVVLRLASGDATPRS